MDKVVEFDFEPKYKGIPMQNYQKVLNISEKQLQKLIEALEAQFIPINDSALQVSVTPNPEEGYINALRSFELDATDLEKVSKKCELILDQPWP